MKSLLPLLLLFTSLYSFGQDYYEREIVQATVFENSEHSAFKYNVNRIDKTAFLKYWKKEMNSKSEEVTSVTEFQIMSKGFQNTAMSKETYTTYVSVKTLDNGLELFIALKDSVGYIDLKKDPHLKDMEKYFEEIIQGVYIEKLNVILKEEQNVLKGIDSDIKKAYKEIAKNDKNILRMESEIENTQKQMEINRSQYDILLNTIQEQKTELATTSKNDENYKLIKKEVKNLEKNKKQMETDYVKNKERIYDNEVSIEETKAAIKNLEENIAQLEEKKLDQKQEILNIEEEIYRLRKI